MACLICGTKYSRPVFIEDQIVIRRCVECGHVFSSFSRPPDYSGYFPEDIGRQNHAWWRDAHELMYREFRERYLVKTAGRLLDFGCGLGYFLKSIEQDKRLAAWELTGVEISSFAANYAQSQLRRARIVAGQLVTADFIPGSFDWITLWDVIEHLPNPRPVLEQLRILLKPGGSLLIATPNVNIQLVKARLKRWFNPSDQHQMEPRDHLHNYSGRSLRRLLISQGFYEARLIQLPPVMAVSGYQGRGALEIAKNLWYLLARSLFFWSGQRLNLNNLFMIAQKK